jgi:hypothetical protein
MVTEESIIFVGDAEGVFQLGTKSEKRRNFPGKFNGKWRIAAAATEGISSQ